MFSIFISHINIFLFLHTLKNLSGEDHTITIIDEDKTIIENLIERYAITGRMDIFPNKSLNENITMDDMINKAITQHLPLHDACDLFEQTYIKKAMEQCEGSGSKAADQLGIHRSLLYKKLKKQEF